MKEGGFSDVITGLLTSLPWIRDLAINLLASFLWSLSLVFFGVVWYWLRLRSKEKVWIRNHGLMLLVYFRNVDWRCKKLRALFAAEDDDCNRSREAIRFELVKLQADLDALDRLTTMWGRRLDTIPFWYPYAEGFRHMLEAQTELHTALSRHTSPLLDLLGRMIDPSVCITERRRETLEAYSSYFKGSKDRLWGKGLEEIDGHPAVKSSDQDRLDQLRTKKLDSRLEELYGHMAVLLGQSTKAVDVNQVYIWRTDERPKEVWFSGKEPDANGVPPATGHS